MEEVKFPNELRKAHFARMIQIQEPAVDDFFGFVDTEEVAQNAMYNCYHSNTKVNNIFAYGPDGKAIICTINFPGSWHDGSIMSNILPYIWKNIGNFKMCKDQGFPRTGIVDQILVGPISKTQAGR